MGRNSEVTCTACGNRDLVGFLLKFLADKPHHLLDLLRDIYVVHVDSDCGSETKKI